MSSNPAQDAKPKRKRRPKPGDTAALRRVMWGAILRAEDVLLDKANEPEVTLRAANAVATLGGAYANVTKTHALEDELRALQDDLRELRTTLSRSAKPNKRSAAPSVN